MFHIEDYPLCDILGSPNYSSPALFAFSVSCLLVLAWQSVTKLKLNLPVIVLNCLPVFVYLIFTSNWHNLVIGYQIFNNLNHLMYSNHFCTKHPFISLERNLSFVTRSFSLICAFYPERALQKAISKLSLLSTVKTVIALASKKQGQSYTFEPSTTLFVPRACFYICFKTF